MMGRMSDGMQPERGGPKDGWLSDCAEDRRSSDRGEGAQPSDHEDRGQLSGCGDDGRSGDRAEDGGQPSGCGEDGRSADRAEDRGQLSDCGDDGRSTDRAEGGGSGDGTSSLPCAICGRAGRGPRAERHLTHGVSIWLCDAHRSDAFMRRRSGKEFVERLAAVWLSSGVLTLRRRQALDSHLRHIQTASADRQQPGSYSWPSLRREAERRFAAGEKPAQVIAELRHSYRDGPAMVPSIRTMRRWFTQARWLVGPSKSRRQQPRATATPRRAGRAHPLIELILTGVAYPTPPPGPRGPRSP